MLAFDKQKSMGTMELRFLFQSSFRYLQHIRQSECSCPTFHATNFLTGLLGRNFHVFSNNGYFLTAQNVLQQHGILFKCCACRRSRDNQQKDALTIEHKLKSSLARKQKGNVPRYVFVRESSASMTCKRIKIKHSM